MQKLVLVRGLPGSGKSTFADKLMRDEGMIHLESDMWFCKETGEYVFDREKLHTAHFWCEDTTKIMLRLGFDVVVSNTFTTESEVNKYRMIAQQLGCEFIIYRMTANYGNIHGVPEEVLQKMRNRMVDIPGEIIISTDLELV